MRRPSSPSFGAIYCIWPSNGSSNLLTIAVLLLATRLSLSDMMTNLFLALTDIMSGLVGAVTALSYVWCVLPRHIPGSSFAATDVLPVGYLPRLLPCAMLNTYLIAWACTEGGNVISVTS
ncbi:hypothetical protein DAEQUDRAFT_724480 [Daedalea quercina L-15889]|uniref:Uncharacterized protein n=1 Tax=Daedalea quercina L-15889 TaxID=1314783 RepID=A0A165RSZ0_9APHY|nr:hypothetical protein DAEQUDRAFT_724480 [Daedalea quercina L-15889]